MSRAESPPAPVNFPMTGSGAPIFRRLDQLTGDVAESPVGAILDTADQVCAELAEVYELRTRVQELESERDDLADRLRSSDNAHKITLGFLAEAKRELANLRREGDVFIGKAAGAL